jgi:hypothetical protein
VDRPTRTPRRVVRWKSLELRILNDRGNTAVGRPRQADSRARPLRRRAEIMLRPARVRIRRRKPWVRLRRRLLGWNVRLVTGKLPNLRSGQQFRYGAHTARIAGGAGRWQRPLWKRPSNGTGHRQTGQTNAVWATRAEPMPFWWPTTWGIGACHLRAPISRAAAVRRSERTLFPFASKTRQAGSRSATSEQITNSPSMSSGHADQAREYRRLGCRAALRLLASRFASQFSLSYRGRRRSLVNLDAGGR